MNPRPTPSDFLPLTPVRRRRIERTVELLIAMLDAMDGEPDTEETGDHEPYLAGWSGTNEDLELEDEHGGDINDAPQGDDDCPDFIWGGNEDGR